MFPRTTQKPVPATASTHLRSTPFDPSRLPGNRTKWIAGRLKIVEETLQGEVDTSIDPAKSVLKEFLVSEEPKPGWSASLAAWCTQNNQIGLLVAALAALPDQPLCLRSSQLAELQEVVVDMLENPIHLGISVDGQQHEVDSERLAHLGHRLQGLHLVVGENTPQETIRAIADALQNTQVSSVSISLDGTACDAGPELLRALPKLSLEELRLEGSWPKSCVDPLRDLFMSAQLTTLSVGGESFADCSTAMKAILAAGRDCHLQLVTVEPHGFDATEPDRLAYVQLAGSVIERDAGIRNMGLGGVRPSELVSAILKNSELENVQFLLEDDFLSAADETDKQAIEATERHLRENRARHCMRERRLEIARPDHYPPAAALGAVKAINEALPAHVDVPVDVMRVIADYVLDDDPSPRQVYDYALTNTVAQAEARKAVGELLPERIIDQLQNNTDASVTEIAGILEAIRVQLTDDEITRIKNEVLPRRDDLNERDIDILGRPLANVQQLDPEARNFGLKRDRDYTPPDRHDSSDSETDP